MREARPIFKRESLLYEREEKEGYFTVLSKVHPETRELIINHTAREILEFCDGKKMLEEIETHFANKYNNVPEERIKFDIFKTLSSFTRLGIVEWEGENPFLYKKEEPLSDGYSFSIGQEGDLRNIEIFIKSIEDQSKPQEGTVFYKNPLIMIGEYSQLVLRQKLFAFSEEFFLLIKESRINGLFSFSLPSHPKEFNTILRLAICPEEFLDDLFKYSRDYLPYLAVRDISKSELYESNLEPINESLKKFVLRVGFVKEAELKDELGFGKNLVIYSLGYSQDFIDKAKGQRSKFV